MNTMNVGNNTNQMSAFNAWIKLKFLFHIMKSNSFVDNLPIFDICLWSVTYKSGDGKGVTTISDTR